MPVLERPLLRQRRIPNILPEPSPYVAVEHPLPQGNINQATLWSDIQGNLYVKKTPKPGNSFDLIKDLSTNQYPSVGFIGDGAAVRKRNFREEAAFMKRLARFGIPTAVPVFADKESLITHYLPGETLQSRLLKGYTSALLPALESVRDAHAMEIPLGDRWPGNIMVQKDGKVAHIDFEVSIEGRFAPELDIAQLLYGTALLAPRFNDVIPSIMYFVQESPNYDWGQITNFIFGYERYNTDPYKNLPDTCYLGEKFESLIKILQR